MNNPSDLEEEEDETDDNDEEIVIPSYPANKARMAGLHAEMFHSWKLWQNKMKNIGIGFDGQIKNLFQNLSRARP